MIITRSSKKSAVNFYHLKLVENLKSETANRRTPTAFIKMEAKKIRPHSVPVWLTADSTQRVHLPPRTSGVFHDSLVSTSTQRPRAPILKPEKTRSILPKRRRQGRKASKK